MASRTLPGPLVGEDALTFSLPDPERALTQVRLRQDLRRPRDEPVFQWHEGTWTATFPRPPVDRLEYQLELRHRDGGVEVVPDPGNPLRAAGPFGERSVLELPGYRAPAWLDALERPLPGELTPWPLPVRALRGAVLDVQLWSAPGVGLDDRVPLLLAHDGPELARYGGLLHLLALAVADRRLPAHRVALLAPVDRDETYSASAAYARGLAAEIVPVLEWLAPHDGQADRVALGASLGALSLLHVHRTRPRAFGGLVLQSGSYFRQRYDRHESGFVRFRRVCRFVGQVISGQGEAERVPILMTCGTGEENLANNRAVAGALAQQGYDVRFVEHRDAHNWVSWRDVWDPHLIDFLAARWRRR